MKKILVPTDFSECSNYASTFAIELAKLAQADVVFVHLMVTPLDTIIPSVDKPGAKIKAEVEKTRANLEALVNKATTHGVKAQLEIAYDKSEDRIFNHIKSYDTDLIVMGTNGRSNLKEKILGSNTEQMIRDCDTPILILKNAQHPPIKKIVFASDFHNLSKAAFQHVTDFADVMNADIDLVYVHTPEEDVKIEDTQRSINDMIANYHRKDACTSHIVKATTEEEGISNFTAQHDSDMIAICTHGRGSIAQLFLPSLTESIARRTELPVLSIRL